ncbi:Bacteriophage lysis protein [compost metagenome]
MIPLWALTHGAVALITLAATLSVTNALHSADLAQMDSAAEHERAEAFRWVAAEQQRRAALVAQADQDASEAISNARKETQVLRACIDRGDGCGLRIKVARPAQCGPVSAADPATGVGDRGGEWAELDPATRQHYYALRDRLPVLEQALRVCVRATQ